MGYKDKTREKQRQASLKKKKAEKEAAALQEGGKKRPAGDGKGQGGVVAQHASGERLTAAKRRKLQARDEVAEMAAEHSLLKKLKRGEITEREFDVATGMASESEDEGDARGGGDAEGGSDGEGEGERGERGGRLHRPDRAVNASNKKARKAARKAAKKKGGAQPKG